jgi:hypothetical protein
LKSPDSYQASWVGFAANFGFRNEELHNKFNGRAMGTGGFDDPGS